MVMLQMFGRPMINLRKALAISALRGVPAVLAVLVLVFCHSSAAPTPGAEPGCQGPELSARICGQSGASDPIPALVQHVPLVQRGSASTTSALVLPPTVSAPQFHSNPSTPRAPPSSLA